MQSSSSSPQPSPQSSAQSSTVRLPRPPWRPLRPDCNQRNCVGTIVQPKCVVEYFPNEVTYEDLARAERIYESKNLRKVLNDVRPKAVAIDEDHMAELMEHAKVSTVALYVRPEDFAGTQSDRLVDLRRLPKGATPGYFTRALVRHACVGLCEFASMDDDGFVTQNVKDALLETFDLDGEARRTICEKPYRAWYPYLSKKWTQ